ncbi:MAG: ATP-grasp domain-containing protein [Bacteroidota bacterium]|nr:ATP-grasp domain-containing protein [Bacteroidota bacterium]MDP4232058.1 ATP-grasp domain-containing protein [Bacteroidota bacterium]MDP4241235.1 ATP-grasp domain-containing protein [Bacteroidota bacterium]MDP4286627.1 ATP-grasp domain-containing protein [Bacteroidota bacterium]
MARQTVVALLYNDIPSTPAAEDRSSADAPVDLTAEALGFTPYFDLEDIPAEQEYANIETALVDAGYKVASYNVKDRFERLFKFLARRKIDVVFNLVEFFHGRPEQEMNVASFYELLEIPYTGAPPFTLALCQNKPLAKAILRSRDLPTPRSITIRTMDDFKSRHNLHYPLIVKPACEDGSGGIENASIVSSMKALKARTEFVLEDFKMDVLIEEYIEGRELNVAVLGNGASRRALPISEITFEDMPEHLYKIVSFQAKWDTLHEAYHKTIPSCPADLPPETAKRAQDLAMKATDALGTRDYARVDMRMNKDGELFILEVNPNPNLSEGTGIARSAKAARIPFKDLLGTIVESALERAKHREAA